MTFVARGLSCLLDTFRDTLKRDSETSLLSVGLRVCGWTCKSILLWRAVLYCGFMASSLMHKVSESLFKVPLNYCTTYRNT